MPEPAACPAIELGLAATASTLPKFSRIYVRRSSPPENQKAGSRFFEGREPAHENTNDANPTKHPGRAQAPRTLPGGRTMSLPMLNRAWLADCGKSPAAKLVLLALSDHHNADTDRCDPSIARIAARCGIDARTVQRSVRILTKLGHVTPKPRPGQCYSFLVHPRHYVTPDIVSPPALDTTTPGIMSPTPGIMSSKGRRNATQTGRNRKKPELNRRARTQTDEQWLVSLKSDPAHQGIDIDHELQKMNRWCSDKGKQPSRRRFDNWLSRCDRPLSPQQPTPSQPKPVNPNRNPVVLG